MTTVRIKPKSACLDCGVRSEALCAALDDEMLGDLESILTCCHIGANQPLVEQGASRLKVYSLTSGMLRLTSYLPDGRRQIAGFLLPGDFLGLADDAVYTQAAEAVIASSACAFAVTDMDGLMQRRPQLKDRLLHMTKTALRRAREDQFMLARLTPLEKLASFIVTMADRATACPKAASTVPLPMGRSDIADYLGLTIETISRSFTKLRTQGLIHLQDTHAVAILDHRALRRLAQVRAEA